MKLYYFNIDDSPRVLKNKRNDLVKKHHPDKAPEHLKATKTEIMKRINAEYEFLLKENNRPKEPTPDKNKAPFNPETMKQAQSIFNLLTNFNTINYLLLISTIIEIKDWKEVSEAYSQMYGISTLKHFQKLLPQKNIGKVLKILEIKR